MKKFLLLSASAMLVSLPAVSAQAEAAEVTSGGGAAPASAEADEAGIKDIIVTAQRREENVQRSAISILAVSSADIVKAGISRPEDLTKIAPGVMVGTGGNMPQVYIRGVGTYATNNYADSPIAMNIDGAFVSRQWELRGAYFDLQRIEVLRGPQGTLYGRNASGGAINLISNRPNFDGISGYVEGEVGNFNQLGLTAAINLPVSDVFAIRVAGQKSGHDGYLSDGYDDLKTEGARVHLLYKPSSDFSLLVTGTYQRTSGQGGGVVPGPDTPLIRQTGDAWIGAGDPRAVAITNANPALLEVAPGVFIPSPIAGSRLLQMNSSGYLNSRTLSLSAELNWDLGPATLTFIPAYREGKQSDRFFVMGFRGDEHELDRQTTFELRLSNQSDKLKWVLGAYYFNEDNGNQPGQKMRTTGARISGEELLTLDSNARSYALFGQATYSVTPELRLTGGLRYTYERKDQSGTAIGYANFLPPGPLTPPGTCPPGLSPLAVTPPDFADNTTCSIAFALRGRVSANAVTWKAGVEYDLAPQSMFYASASTGFKSGGLYSGPIANPTYKPERLTSFEVGLKNRFLDNKVQLNVEGFYYIYKDHQESHLSEFPGVGYDGFITENAGKAHSYGIQASVIVQPTKADRLAGSVQWNQSKYDSFSYGYPSAAGGAPATGCAVGAVDANRNYPVDCSGFQLVRTPLWTGSVDYSHSFNLANGGSVELGGHMEFASGSYLAIDFLPSERNNPYALFDANLTYNAPAKNWSISAWVRNIGDKAVYTQAFRHPFVLPSPVNALAGPTGLIGMSVRPPRTYGVRMNVSF